MYNRELAKKSADTIRVLAAEAIQKAKSGHPGMPLGCADYAFTLWDKYLRHDPADPKWIGRDRFVLSAGHGSMLLYSLLHLFNYEGMTMEQLQQFRQWGSLTPGHPEFGHTAGVEVTTGPLGSGFSSAVGMAIALKHFGAVTGLDKAGFADQKVYVISGDGCMMEGCTSESASLAGHLKLDNLVVFYDDNAITIEGSTNLAFTENVAARFQAYNWRIIRVANANDASQCDAALAEAQKSDGRPTLIVGKTAIGYGAPNKQGKPSAHGEPLGDDELAALKANLGLPGTFTVEPDVRAYCDARCKELTAAAAEWNAKYNAFLNADSALKAQVENLTTRAVPADITEKLLAAAPVDKPVASRASSGTVLQAAAAAVPSLFGGAADLSPSTKSNLKEGGDFSADNYAGRNLHFGIRELAMGLAANGMALTGLNIPYTSTFFVFSDYMKPAIRLAAIQKLHQIYVFTHDSFYVGEDGPTHEPIEQIAMLRSIPGVTVIRPAEAHEVAGAWAEALKADGPVALLFTRQNLDPFAPELAKKVDVSKGAYVLEDDPDYNVILVATGSEVNLALGAAKLLREKQIPVRVVSMPSQELFLKQSPEYQSEVLPFGVAVVSIEAGSTFGWDRFADLTIGLDEFGASAPYKKLAEELGFTPEAVVEQIMDAFADDDCCCGDDNCGCGCHHDK
ncbi:MAG: transketolase [Lentisphaeria bacterium]|nr:transketolase [Lentisphaeria bacterium]